ncbi:MAG: hypothetical protein IKS90_00150 [Clostridia bacterium]|nr:hypothetical protein [Clostridia bacterium]
MRPKDEYGLPIPRYFPVIDIDDSGKHKVAMFPALSDSRLKDSGNPYLEEIMDHIYHLHSSRDSGEIACPCCGKKMEHYYTPNNTAVYLCRYCL